MALHSQTLKISKDGDPITHGGELYPLVNLALHLVSCWNKELPMARNLAHV